MAVSRIPGPALFDNLTRNGVDISVETDLLYIDVNNKRIGINRAIPTVAFDLNGSALFSNALKIQGANISSEATNANINFLPNGTGKVTVSTLTAGRVMYVGTGSTLVDSANLTFDGTNLTVAGINITSGATANLGNISISDNTISSTNTNGNINITPNGTGNLIVSTATANRVFYSGTNKEVITNANLTFDGTQFTVLGTANITTVNAGNVQISSNTIASSDTNGNVTLSPNGTGNIIVNTATATRVFYAGANKELLTDSDLTFDGNNLSIGNITVGNNTIISSNTDGNIYLDPNGIGRVIVTGTNALTIPVGSIAERPTGTIGDIRYNNYSNLIEYWNGTSWSTLSPAATSIVDAFNGDGSTVVFTLSQASSSNASIVTLNGVVQSPGVAYSVTSTTLTFTEAPVIGDRIEVRYNSGTVELGLDKTILTYVIDGGLGDTITTGSKKYLGPMNFGGRITAGTLLADQAGSVSIEIRKCTYDQFDAGATHPVAGDKITASAPLTLTSAVKSQDTTLTGWTVNFAAGDIFEFIVNSAETVTWLQITLAVTRG